MAFFDLDVGHSKHPLRILCFSGAYNQFADFIKVGLVAKFDLAKANRKGDAMMLDEDSSIEIISRLSDRKVIKNLKTGGQRNDRN